MSALLEFVREFLLAVQFFTRIPITGRLADWVGYSPEMLRASAAHFPGVGIVVGAVAAAVYAGADALLPENNGYAPLVAACLSTVATALLTGAFHEDGLADVADGLGGSYERERALEIMKDSRVGAFGALALVLALLSKVALVALLGAQPESKDWPAQSVPLVCAALILGHTFSRALPLLLVRWLAHVGHTAQSKSKPLAESISNPRLALAFVWCFVALAPWIYAGVATYFIAAIGFAVLALLWMGRWFWRRLQGFTGDCLGAAQQVCEIAFYFGLAISL